MAKKKLRAAGMTCGVGSMLIGARQSGFEIVGNIEWRKYYHTGTFEHNFPTSWMVKHLDELTPKQWDQLRGIDLLMGHPECGNFSNLQTSKNRFDMIYDAMDIPLFVEAVAKIRPRYFVMDDLPLSFTAYPITKYTEALPDYDIYPEWVSNFHHGNGQKNRRRLFIIGALKSEQFVFHADEFDHDKSIKQIIGDLPAKDIPAINHIHMKGSDRVNGWAAYMIGLNRKKQHLTLEEFQKYFLRKLPTRQNLPYINKKGENKRKPGYSIIDLDNYAPVMTGGGASSFDNHYRADTLNPLTMRERARIQGVPDDFIFQPLDFMKDRKLYVAVYKQIGKFMPVEFCTSISNRIRSHINRQPVSVTGERKIAESPLVTEAKKTVCREVGLSRQREACMACWIRPCEISPIATINHPHAGIQKRKVMKPIEED